MRNAWPASARRTKACEAGKKKAREASASKKKASYERYRRNQAPQNAVAEKDGNLHRQAKLQPWPYQGRGGREETTPGRALSEGAGGKIRASCGEVRAGRGANPAGRRQGAGPRR